jgi:hypothetical protein
LLWTGCGVIRSEKALFGAEFTICTVRFRLHRGRLSVTGSCADWIC